MSITVSRMATLAREQAEALASCPQGCIFHNGFNFRQYPKPLTQEEIAYLLSPQKPGEDYAAKIEGSSIVWEYWAPGDREQWAAPTSAGSVCMACGSQSGGLLGYFPAG